MFQTRTSAAPSSPHWSNWIQGLRQELDPKKEASRRVLLSDLKIRTKDQQLVPFTPNAVQVKMLDEVAPRWREGEISLKGKGFREFILKARQFGFSTLIGALYFLETVNEANTLTLIVAHDQETTENLFGMMHTFWEELPDAKRPKTKYKSKRQLHFAHNGSKIRVMTARKKGGGRSLTVHNLHLSEAAFYQNPKLLTGLLQAVPAGGNVFVESTANGEGGDGQTYHDQYWAGIAPQNWAHYWPKEYKSNGYQARFYAWWEHDEYEADLPGESGSRSDGFTRDDDEKTIVAKYGLDKLYGRQRTDRKLAWRRRKMAEPGMGTLFPQEYPGDPKEAFLVSGKRFFIAWNKDVHVVHATEISLDDIATWQFFGGLDWGFHSPFCFELMAADPWGDVLVLDEEYESGLTDPEQAEHVLACLKRWNLRPGQVPIYADSNMWSNKADNLGKIFQNVSAYQKADLWMIRAKNGAGTRKPSLNNAQRYLIETTKRPEKSYRRVRVSSRCENLIRTIPLMVRDKTDPEDMENDPALTEDHAVDGWRYGLQSRSIGADPLKDKPPKDPLEDWVKRQRGESEKKRKL
jgi:hypothetical protein